MAGIVALVLVVALGQIAYSAYRIQQTRLHDEVMLIKGLIEASGRFDALHSADDHPGGSVGATLAKLTEALKRLPLEEDSEIVLAERRGQQLFFIVAVHGFDFVGEKHETSRYGLGLPEYSLSQDGPVALPMKKALNGESGTVLAQDYRDVPVFAAFTPVEIAGRRFGLVAKVNAWAVWLPVIEAGGAAAVLAALLIGLGTWHVLRLVDPLIGRLEEEVGANQAMIQTSPSAIVTINDRGAILQFNGGAERMFGYSAAEVCGRNVKILMPEDVAARHDGFLERTRQHSGRIQIFGVGREVKARRKDGSAFPVNISVGIARSRQGTRYIGIITDQTRHQRAEAALVEQRDALEQRLASTTEEIATFVRTAPSGVVTFDIRGEIALFNPAAERMFGWLQAEATGLRISALIPEVGDAASGETGGAWVLALVSRTAAGERREVEARRRDETTFPAHLTVGQARLADGREIFIAFIDDISEWKGQKTVLQRLLANAGQDV